jgi:hypothetical protein
MLLEQFWTIAICLAVIGGTGLVVYRFFSPML